MRAAERTWEVEEEGGSHSPKVKWWGWGARRTEVAWRGIMWLRGNWQWVWSLGLIEISVCAIHQHFSWITACVFLITGGWGEMFILGQWLEGKAPWSRSGLLLPTCCRYPPNPPLLVCFFCCSHPELNVWVQVCHYLAVWSLLSHFLICKMMC